VIIAEQAIATRGRHRHAADQGHVALPFISGVALHLLLMGLLVGIIINSQRTCERPSRSCAGAPYGVIA